MNSVLHASFMYAQIVEENDVIMVGFADDEFDTQNYVLLQRTLNPSQEDVKSGFDKIHITYNEESQSLYDGILKFYFTENFIEITLNEEATKIFNTSVVVVNYECKIDINEFHNYLIRMFLNEPEKYFYKI